MFGLSRDSVNGYTAGYKSFDPIIFNSKVPSTYEFVSSNKDSIRVCVTGAGDADTTAFSLTAQGLAYGTGTYVSLGAQTFTFPSATLARICANYGNPGLLKFRFRGIGAGTTDTTDVYRFEVYDK